MAKVDVCFSGGSGEGICSSCGALEALVSDKGHEIVAAAGNSAGGIVLGCHAAGMSPAEIESMILETDFTRFISMPAWWNPVGWALFLKRGWLSDGEKFLKFLSELTGGKKFKDAKFDLHLAGSDYPNYRLVDINRENYPDAPLAVGMRITSCLPGGFKPVQFDGTWWYDGGVRRHYPVDFLPESDRPLFGWLVGALTPGVANPVPPRTGLLGVLGDLTEQAVDGNVQDGQKLAKRVPITAAYDDVYVSTFDFSIDRDEKKRLIEEGRRRMLAVL